MACEKKPYLVRSTVLGTFRLCIKMAARRHDSKFDCRISVHNCREVLPITLALRRGPPTFTTDEQGTVSKTP
jgi:hypothetical protein